MTGEKCFVTEEHEWDNLWIEETGNTSSKRIMYIGDSVSCSARHYATEISDGEFVFDGVGTSKSMDNPFYKEIIKIFARQEKRRDAIIFNFGLHGWHLEDGEEFKKYYRNMMKFLSEEFKGTPLFVALTTHVKDGETEKRVLKRNISAIEVAGEFGLPVIDLYKAGNNDELLSSDGIHFTEAGYRILAEKIISDIKKFYEVKK